MLRAEAGRCSEQDHIDLTVDYFLEGVQPEILAGRVRLDPGGDLGLAFERLQAAVDLRLVDVGHGGQLGVIVGLQGLRRGAAAAASTAHQSYFDGIGHGLRRNDSRESGCNGRPRRAAGGLEKITPLGICRLVVHSPSLFKNTRLPSYPSRKQAGLWQRKSGATEPSQE